MAYRDPEKLRRKRVALWLTPEEDRYLEALADLTGSQKAVLARTMMLQGVREAQAQFASGGRGDKAPFEA